MAFQPFGLRFDIRTPLSTERLKAEIRRKKHPWFEKRSGARGWIAGPFICLWSSAFDQFGPMLIGRISTDSLGSRITGRAGSDLNGVIAFAFCGLFMIAMLPMILLSGQGNLATFAMLAMFIGFAGPLMLWMAHKDRLQAIPLVRFLEEISPPSRPVNRPVLSAKPLDQRLTLTIDGDDQEGALTEELIFDSLSNLSVLGSIILSRDNQDYIQTASVNGHVLLERRLGPGQHLRAIPRALSSTQELPKLTIDLDTVHAAFLAFASNDKMPPSLDWKRMNI